jgi:multiple sugar transport system permease protein
VLVQTAQGKVPRGRRLRKQLVPVALLAPAVTLVAAVIAYPLVRAVWLSFQNFNILRPAATTSAGFANYAARLADPVFWGAALNSLQWVVGVVVFQLLFGFFGALLLNQRFPLRGLVRGVLLIPWATPSVLVAPGPLQRRHRLARPTEHGAAHHHPGGHLAGHSLLRDHDPRRPADGPA